jgi:uncharacterized protein YuzE
VHEPSFWGIPRKTEEEYMKITYDKGADAAYIYLADIPPRAAKKTYPCYPREVNGMINFDFDANGVLMGIEILSASQKLPKGLIEKADLIG